MMSSKRFVPLSLALLIGTMVPLAAAPQNTRALAPVDGAPKPSSDAALPTSSLEQNSTTESEGAVADDNRKASPDDETIGGATLGTATESEAAVPVPDKTAESPPVSGAAANAPHLMAGAVDLTVLTQAIDFYRKGKFADGDRLRDGFSDPGARALLEWVAIRAGTGVDFERIARFVRANPDWPFGPMLRRRAEERLLAERKPPALVRGYFGSAKPVSAPGKLALALAFRADGLTDDAASTIREMWRENDFGRTLETRVMDTFPGILTTSDHRFRMERALLNRDWDIAGRAADYTGPSYASLVRARRAVESKSAMAAQALNAVPARMRNDSSYILSRAQYLRRSEKYEEAARLLVSAPTNAEVIVDGDEWWIERRIVARKLIDLGDARTAQTIASAHSAQMTDKRIEAEFHAGWIALRFLSDPQTAEGHFAKAAAVAETPISVARAGYWQGRAAEALSKTDEAKKFYARAASYPIAYYGQLARNRLGQDDLTLRKAAELDGPARASFEQRSFVRALRLLSTASLRDLSLALFIDGAKLLTSEAELNALGDVAVQTKDARALVAIGKAATQRGYALDIHAFPTLGIPDYEASTAVPVVEKAMVLAIARQESQFDPRAQSSVGARGLMQMMPGTAQRTARRVAAPFDVARLTGDPAYNARLGHAHLGELMEEWRGSYIMAFAAYNAGGGNVRKWVNAFGDPRKGEIDAVDWVERIPFSETRNYVQRVMENLQVYRQRLNGRHALTIEADMVRHGRPGAVSVEAKSAAAP